MPSELIMPVSILAIISIKWWGYSAFAKHLNTRYRVDISPLKVGFARMFIGFLFGVFFSLFAVFSLTPVLTIIGFTLLRAIEWYIVIQHFYGTVIINRSSLFKAIFKGVGISYLLDIPSLLLFYLTGYKFVC